MDQLAVSGALRLYGIELNSFGGDVAFRAGKRVKAKTGIRGGAWTSDARAGQKGAIISISGNKAKVFFERDGIGWPETTISDVSLDDLVED